MTVWLSLICLAASMVIGLAGGCAQGALSALLRRAVAGYIEFFRNTPPLVQLYVFYFALGSLMPTTEIRFGLQEPILDNFAWAVIALSFFAGAFNVEIFRSGIEAVPDSTKEAAEALGYTRLQTYIYIVLPLAFRVCLPALNKDRKSTRLNSSH